MALNGGDTTNDKEHMSKVMTQGGHLIDVLDIDPELVELEDVAHSLAHICRFNGHCPGHYSVAQHANLVSLLCEEECKRRGLDELAVVVTALHGLHHDDDEYLFGDFPSPIRRHLYFKTSSGDMVHFNVVAREARVAILAALEIPLPELLDTDLLRHADNHALCIEWASMGRDTIALGPRRVEDETRAYRPAAAAAAKAMWLRRHHQLMGRYELILDELGEVEL